MSTNKSKTPIIDFTNFFLVTENLDISFKNGYNNRKEIYKPYFVNGGAYVQLISVSYRKLQRK